MNSELKLDPWSLYDFKIVPFELHGIPCWQFVCYINNEVCIGSGEFKTAALAAEALAAFIKSLNIHRVSFI